MKTKQRSMPWIHRWFRPLSAGVATIGAIITAYLTITKFTQSSAACPTGGCDVVLSSPYATAFGLPLALFGFLGYASMMLFAVLPLLIKAPEQKQLRSRLESATGLLLFLGGLAMTIFSGYLIYLLIFEIKAVCVYCIASAVLSISLLVLAILERNWDDLGLLAFTGSIVGMIVLVSSFGLYASSTKPTVESTVPGGYSIATSSGAAETALAQHLKQTGAKMYGAFTCPHCQNQKHLFGKEAASQLSYIECHPQGQNAQPELCQSAGIQGFPTWKINGKLHQGEKSLQELADLSGYQGKRNFQNTELPDH